MRLPERSSGFYLTPFFLPQAEERRLVVAMTVLASEPPMKYRRSAFDFVHTSNFIAFSWTENGV